ncbi:carbohydrate ABC transporter permease [Ochrobactrum sp. Q0168]|uniref:carbohydrate ABC transporter permease n=1 Tax=Ochrobactrum TaxID=528 RepID=UPI0014356836|nr:carbohydrate ABC transporter permease [[Ochrobactrum] soli]MBJ6134942.1 carbohydrate ABC transporter permease [Ochrobactrum sp. Q0168]
MKRAHWSLVLLAYLLAFIISIPLLWMVKSSFESDAAATAYPPALLPDGHFIGTFSTIFFDTRLFHWLLNSFLVAALSTLVALAIGIPAAYGLSRFKFRHKSLLTLSILGTQMMPPIVLIIPLYTTFISFGLADSLVGVIVANAAFALPVMVWMLKTVFDGVSFEIDEAARIDGASWYYIALRIVTPLSLPGVIAASIFSFLNAWDEFMLARTLLRSVDQWVGTIGLSSLFGEYVTPWNQIMAMALVFTIPPVLLFLLVQRYFVSGLSAGAVKG